MLADCDKNGDGKVLFPKILFVKYFFFWKIS